MWPGCWDMGTEPWTRQEAPHARAVCAASTRLTSGASGFSPGRWRESATRQDSQGNWIPSMGQYCVHVRHCSFLESVFYLPLPFPSSPFMSERAGPSVSGDFAEARVWLAVRLQVPHLVREMPWWGCGVGKGPPGPHTGGLYASSCCLRPAGVSAHSGQHRPARPQSSLAISSKPSSPTLMTITVNDMCLPHADGRLVKAHKTK